MIKYFGYLIFFIIFSAIGFVVYTRFFSDVYDMKDNTLSFKNLVYVRQETIMPSDEENLGHTIGVAIVGKRTLTDLIWPNWVMEYRDDPNHQRLFVRGLMDIGRVYIQTSDN